MREIVIALGCATAIGAVACQVQGQCSASFVEYCGPNDSACQGHIIDATHWESGPQTGNFLPYNAEQTILMHFRDAKTNQLLTGQNISSFVQVSATQQGDVLGSAYIPCADQLCELTDDPDGHSLWVKNDTCGSYFVRVIVTVIPTTDAGTE